MSTRRSFLVSAVALAAMPAVAIEALPVPRVDLYDDKGRIIARSGKIDLDSELRSLKVGKHCDVVHIVYAHTDIKPVKFAKAVWVGPRHKSMSEEHAFKNTILYRKDKLDFYWRVYGRGEAA